MYLEQVYNLMGLTPMGVEYSRVEYFSSNIKLQWSLIHSIPTALLK
jgi:hypothetical protein